MAKIGNIGFIGVGKMGSALLEGVLRAGLAGPGETFISEVDQERRKAVCESSGVKAAGLLELVENCQVIVLCVKPQVVVPVLREIRSSVGSGKLILSVAAGVTTATIEAELGSGVPVVRSMPNIAATVGQSATAVSAGSAAGGEHLELAGRIFGSVGLVVQLPERLIDAVTGLSGSGPAYVFLFAEALVSGALKVGLPHDEARKLVVQTIKGASAMLEAQPDVHPAFLRDAVTTPGGTTVAALHELEKRGFRDAVISAVEAAAKRSQELGKG
ncbi:MAG TPA: pyrroline-5-carboxylate reductase [archaeon]|nr:pyrroline-5-carboxylate reductase [archaeon]